ncbi:MAG: oligopeptide/dipeptide ABC transporter ATP-binding protein [Burkholderiales bacterium]
MDGQPPDLASLPAGCGFMPRCRQASSRCAAARPRVRAMEGEHHVACVL